MAQLLDEYLAHPVDLRHRMFSEGVLRPTDQNRLFQQALDNIGTPYAIFQDDPVGFVKFVLVESLTDVQTDIMTSVVDSPRVVVPSCFGSGKTHIEARLCAWWSCVWPIGTASTVMTATRMRQVLTQTWPHVRRLVVNAGLPGDAQATQWMVPRFGDDLVERVAWGFTPPAYDPEAVQGIHDPHVLVLIDEGGGFTKKLGQAWLSATTGLHTRIAVFGNPPVDAEDSWLESISTSGEWKRIPISAKRILNDPSRGVRCRSCVDWRQRPHPVGDHLISDDDVRVFISEYGEDSAFVASKVHAEFVKGAIDKAIPAKWLDKARVNRKDGDLYPENLEELRRSGDRVRLGVDIAGPGKDELVVARKEGRVSRITLAQRGAPNENAVTVAGYILEEIRAAEELARELNLLEKVEVCVDVTGMGWGPVSTLQAWGSEGRHGATVVGVSMGERAEDPEKFVDRRSEMWWAGREAVRIRENETEPRTFFDIEDKAAGQMQDPKWKTESDGRIRIEKNDDMKKRGRPSPDRATALCLAEYRPHSLLRGAKSFIIGEISGETQDYGDGTWTF